MEDLEEQSMRQPVLVTVSIPELQTDRKVVFVEAPRSHPGIVLVWRVQRPLVPVTLRKVIVTPHCLLKVVSERAAKPGKQLDDGEQLWAQTFGFPLHHCQSYIFSKSEVVGLTVDKRSCEFWSCRRSSSLVGGGLRWRRGRWIGGHFDWS